MKYMIMDLLVKSLRTEWWKYYSKSK